MKLPNFFVVGAPRAGSTSLYHHLDQHPDIYMSPMKETNYFVDEFNEANFAPELQPELRRNAESQRRWLDGPLLEKRFGGYVTEWNDYWRLFAGVREERAVGEASVCYLWSKTAAERIASRLPHAKILMVLRNPIDRAYSQHLQTVNTSGLRGDLQDCSFRQHIEASLAHDAGTKISPLHPFLECGLYAEQVLRYRRLFPAEQIGLWLYEERSEPEFMKQVYRFLGVDEAFVPDMAQRHLEQQVPQVPGLKAVLKNGHVRGALRRVIPAGMRSTLHGMVFKRSRAMHMLREDREFLIEYYREDVLRLGELLQRDLSEWLR